MHKNTGMFMPVWSTSLCMLNYIYFLPLFHMGKNHGTMCEIPLVLYLLTYKQRLWKLVPFDFQDNLMHGLTKKICGSNIVATVPTYYAVLFFVLSMRSNKTLHTQLLQYQRYSTCFFTNSDATVSVQPFRCNRTGCLLS